MFHNILWIVNGQKWSHLSRYCLWEDINANICPCLSAELVSLCIQNTIKGSFSLLVYMRGKFPEQMYMYTCMFIIDREAWEIICLVVSVCPPISNCSHTSGSGKKDWGICVTKRPQNHMFLILFNMYRWL